MLDWLRRVLLIEVAKDVAGIGKALLVGVLRHEDGLIIVSKALSIDLTIKDWLTIVAKVLSLVLPTKSRLATKPLILDIGLRNV